MDSAGLSDQTGWAVLRSLGTYLDLMASVGALLTARQNLGYLQPPSRH
jgi:hypothetical protein